MPDPRHLSNAPIVEAVVDVSVVSAETFPSDALTVLVDGLKNEYPHATPISGEIGELIAGGASHREGTGFLLQTSDQKIAVQLRRDGFTFSRLKPYTSWAEIFPEVLRLWTRYVEAAKPVQVDRIAVRYINRLELPVPVTFETYLPAAPRVPEELPQSVVGFVSQVLMEDEHQQLASIVQALEGAMSESTVSVLLDIEAFRDFSVSPTDVQVERVLASLREFKNRIFFASVTPKALELWT